MLLGLCKVLGTQTRIRGIHFLKNFIVQWLADMDKAKKAIEVCLCYLGSNPEGAALPGGNLTGVVQQEF